MRWLLVAVVVVLVALLAWLLGEDVEVPRPDSRPDASPAIEPTRDAAAPAAEPETSSRGRREERLKRRAAEAAKPRPAFEPGRIDPDAVSRSDITLRGVVVDPTVLPVVGASVKVSVTRAHPEDLQFETVRGDPERGLGGYRGNSESSVLSGGGGQRTNAEGRFAIPLPSEGRVLISVYSEGYGVAREKLGWVNLSRSRIRFVLRRDEVRRSVRVMNGDKPFAGVEVGMTDLSYGDWQPGSPGMKTDADGRIPTAWFETGHLHVVRVKRTKERYPKPGPAVSRSYRGYVIWDGQDTLDLSDRNARAMQPGRQDIRRKAKEYRRLHPWRTPPRLPDRTR